MNTHEGKVYFGPRVVCASCEGSGETAHYGIRY